MYKPVIEYTVWGWVFIDNEPKFIEFNKYVHETDTYLHSVNPEHDYMLDPENLAKTKNELISRQITHCITKRDYWNDAIIEYARMMD